MVIVYSLYIINKSGGVVYHQTFHKDAPKLGMNDYLRLGSTFHGLYAITSQLSPAASTNGGSSSGLQILQTDTFRLQCLQTSTGTKFYLIAEPNAQNLETILQNIYELYSDYVLKNPFYELEQPIRCEQFDIQLEKLLLPSVEKNPNLRTSNV
jgi:hypothetical protein